MASLLVLLDRWQRSIRRHKSIRTIFKKAAKAATLVSIEERKWSTLMPDLLELISDRLNIRDYVRFRLVCTNWRLAPSGRSSIDKFSQDSPWFMVYNSDKMDGDKCFFYQTSHSECLTIQLPALRGATCLVSKFGWLLAHRSDHLFFFNPLTFASIELPSFPRLNPAIQTFIFAHLPSSPDCSVILISKEEDSATVEISLWHKGDNGWVTTTIDTQEVGLGTIRDAISCKCSSSCDVSACKLSGWVGCKWSHDKIFWYNFRSKKWKLSKFVPSEATPILKELNKFHKGGHWLQKFGKKGVSISTCLLNMTMDGVSGICNNYYVVGDNGSSKAEELSRVKAAWIDPRFESCIGGR